MKTKNGENDFPVVCVGGSAGGLGAYIRLLRHLPADMGVAIVIVNHLRTTATMLHEILPRYTEMPVELIKERLVIQPDHVFIIPEHHDLHVLDQVDKKIREGNLGTAEGWVKQSFINIFISLEDIKKGIPEYADAIIHEITKSKTRDQIKTMLSKQLKQYSNQTFDTGDSSQMTRILLRIDSKDIESARIKLNKAISVKHNIIYNEAILLIIILVILFALSGFDRQPLAPSRYILLILALIMLLIAGVTIPTIDMEAKILQMSFVLIGHPILFKNQVLYFQCKSILDVFWIMITHQDIQMKFVGVLLITFSIIIPLLKIVASLGYYYNYHHVRENRVRCLSPGIRHPWLLRFHRLRDPII